MSLYFKSTHNNKRKTPPISPLEIQTNRAFPTLVASKTASQEICVHQLKSNAIHAQKSIDIQTRHQTRRSITMYHKMAAKPLIATVSCSKKQIHN
jgi:hypothetical protein